MPKCLVWWIMKTLFMATLNVVDIAANCYALEDANIDPTFWEPLYGQYDDDPYSLGMLPWIFDYNDYGYC